MFGSSNNDKAKKKPVAPVAKKENSGFFTLCENSIINGNVTTNEPAVINGTVEGTISVENNLKLGPKGVVRGPVYAHTMHVEGAITGDIVCKGTVHVTATARITGNVQCTALIVAEGAYFCGKLVCDKAAEEPAGEAEQTEPAKEE